MRGRNRKNPNSTSRSYESNGPDVKIRGSAIHVAEKYVQLSRDASVSGDRVMAENYLQHAEHYFRIVAASQQQNRDETSREQRDDDGRFGFDRDDAPGWHGNNGEQPYVENYPSPGGGNGNAHANGQGQTNGHGGGNGGGGGPRHERSNNGHARPEPGIRFDSPDRRGEDGEPESDREEQRVAAPRSNGRSYDFEPNEDETPAEESASSGPAGDGEGEGVTPRRRPRGSRSRAATRSRARRSAEPGSPSQESDTSTEV